MPADRIDESCSTQGQNLAARMIQMVRLRKTDPHAALLVDVLGIKIADAQDESISNRLRILRQLNAALLVMREWGRNGNWLYDVNRHLNIKAAWNAELTALSGRLWTMDDEQIVAAQAVLNQAA